MSSICIGCSRSSLYQKIQNSQDAPSRKGTVDIISEAYHSLQYWWKISQSISDLQKKNRNDWKSSECIVRPRSLPNRKVSKFQLQNHLVRFIFFKGKIPPFSHHFHIQTVFAQQLSLKHSKGQPHKELRHWRSSVAHTLSLIYVVLRTLWTFRDETERW